MAARRVQTQQTGGHRLIQAALSAGDFAEGRQGGGRRIRADERRAYAGEGARRGRRVQRAGLCAQHDQLHQ